MKIIISVFLMIVLVVSLRLDVDSLAMEIQNEAFDRAMLAFGLAKGLNAVISLLQGTELSFTPVGIGMNFSIGEILDPFNDLVERFSWVMLFASVSLGIQKLVLILSAKLFVQVAFGVSVVVSLVLLWMKKMQGSMLLGYTLKAFLLLLLLRFSAIVFLFLSQFFYNSVLQNEYETASKVIEQTKTELEAVSSQTSQIKQAQQSGFFSRLNAQYTGFSQSLNISTQLERLQKSIEETSRKIITLITVFTVQSVILPLLYLWFLIGSVKAIFRVKYKKLVYNILK